MGQLPVLLNIGFGNMVMASKVVAIVGSSSAPVKRLREEAAKLGKLVDATQGRKTRAIVVVDSGHIILSAVHPETIAQRLDVDAATLAAQDPEEGEEAQGREAGVTPAGKGRGGRRARAGRKRKGCPRDAASSGARGAGRPQIEARAKPAKGFPEEDDFRLEEDDDSDDEI